MLTARGLLIVERRALVLLDPDSGEELSRRTFEGIDLRDVAVTNDAVYLLTLSDELIALR